MSRWNLFFRNIQQDLKLFVFVLMMLCGLRLAFIGWLHNYMNEATTSKDILISLWYGMRFSFKSAGVIAALTWIFCTLVNVVWIRPKLDKLRWWLGCIYIALLSVLFQARIPYYEQFHSGFNQFIFNTFHDDGEAIFYTFVQQYQLFGRLALATIMTAILGYLLKRWLNKGTFIMPEIVNFWAKLALRSTVVAVMAVFMIFMRFGGSLAYSHSVNWENYGVSSDDFLNEAILDDIQALYRAREINEVMQSAKGIHVNVDEIRQYGQYLAGNKLDSNDVESYLLKKTQGPKLKKPQQIYIILGESQAEWPLMAKYANLHIADGLKGIISQNNAAYMPALLPNGPFTQMAVNAVVTGLAEVNLYPNYQPESYKAPYATAIAPQMKKLGYKTCFWYGGFSSWAGIKDFVLAQGFDEFHAFDEHRQEAGNVWGADDKLLFETIENKVDDNQPTVHVILTSSNHAPYTVDLAAEGFPKEAVRASLPDYAKDNENLLKQLGHYWYADKFISKFVQTMYERNSESLFMITGDHADRMNIEPNPDVFTRYVVPMIIYGQGVDKDLLPKNIAGNQIHLLPTLFELIAPADFNYYSVGKSLTLGNNVGVNHLLWITDSTIGKLENDFVLKVPGSNNELANFSKVHQEIEAMEAISWWRIKNGRYF